MANAGSHGGDIYEELSPTLRVQRLGGSGMPATTSHSAVRRLTPRECERLQGFPDDYTLAPHRGKPMADGPRYKALGNSMAVPVMAYIGRRIQMVEALAPNSNPTTKDAR
jgi:DNA (cytosine-5)-methyltransferase 1